jgi:hypothetical protein
MPGQYPVLTFLVDPEVLERLDRFQVTHGLPSRAAAVKWLLRWALDHAPEVQQRP